MRNVEERPTWFSEALEGKAQPKRAVVLGPGRLVPGTRYEIVRWLGDGGMGVVFEARHLDLDKRVALKIMRAEVCRDPGVLDQFRQEARTASQLGSEYIVEVFDFAELPDGRLLFAMELVDGTSLSDDLRGRTMDPSRVIGILRQLCKALATAHAHGILHRDIKPENILLRTTRGRPDGVKILDFGISTMMVEGTAAAPEVSGTPYYLAPEILEGRRFDGRADMYSIGCTAYEMLVGQPPFLHEDVVAVLRGHLKQTPVPISKARGDDAVPPALERVIEKCLAKRPEDRYADMEDLEAALCEAQIEADLRTAWDDLALPEVEPERRGRLLRDMPDQITDVVSIVEPRRRGRAFPAIVVGVVLVVGITIGTIIASKDDHVDPQSERLEQLTEAAWGAAGKSLYVYPPPDAPDRKTAYAIVREIESMQGAIAPLADDRAAALRKEMGATLVRLGDEFWEREGGLEFAIDYYAQAVLFDPSQEVARERASLTPGQLALLRHKAEIQDFDPGELMAVEPLVVLADEDEKERTSRLASLRKKARADSRSLAEQAQSALKAGDAGKAKHLFERALAKNGRNVTALVGLSEILMRRKEFDRAASRLERVVSIKPKSANYRVRLGDAYYQAKRYRDALDQYERALDLGDKSAAYWVQRTRKKLGL